MCGEETRRINLRRTIGKAAALMGWRFLFCREFLMSERSKIMNSGLNNKVPDPSEQPPVNPWDKWLRATGVDDGYGYRVPEVVWNAVWHGNWPDDEETIQWILEEYFDLETAKAHGYFELVPPLREEAEAALDAAKRKAAEQLRQIKIDADIDEVIKTIRGLGLESDEKPSAPHSCGEEPSRKRRGWVRATTPTIIAAVVAAVAGLVGGYHLRALNQPADIALPRSLEIRRAIPVEPQIRMAIPVELEIRKAIPTR
jgi:hypothetical protein